MSRLLVAATGKPCVQNLCTAAQGAAGRACSALHRRAGVCRGRTAHFAVFSENRMNGPHTLTTTALGTAPALPLASAACVAFSTVPRSVATSRAIGVPRPRASPVRFTAIASAGTAGMACRTSIEPFNKVTSVEVSVVSVARPGTARHVCAVENLMTKTD